MVTCPKCRHEFVAHAADGIAELAAALEAPPPPPEGPDIRVNRVFGFEELLSADAKAAYAVSVGPEAEALQQIQFLGAISEVSLAESRVNDDAEKLDMHRQTARIAHVYNRGVQEGWFRPGVLAGLIALPLAVIDLRVRTALSLYPVVREDLRGDAGRERLNKLFGGFQLFGQAGELGFRQAWDGYAAVNGLE